MQPGANCFDNVAGIGASPDPGLGGVTAGASIWHYPSPLEDPNQRQDAAPGISPNIHDVSTDIHSSLRVKHSVCS